MFEKTETNPITEIAFGNVRILGVVNQIKSKSPINPLEKLITSGITTDINQSTIKVNPPPISNFPHTFFGNLKNLKISGKTKINKLYIVAVIKYPAEPFGLTTPGNVLTTSQKIIK